MEMSPESPMFVFTEKCSVFQTSRSVLPRVKWDVLYPGASRTYEAVELLWSRCCPQLSAVIVVLSACSPERSRASKGSRTGASLNLLPFLIPPSLFQDVEIQVLHRAMPSALNSSVSDECISSPMLREADAQLIPTGAQEDLDLQLVRPWRMITCILMLPSEVHSYPHPIPLFLQLLLLSTTIGDTS